MTTVLVMSRTAGELSRRLPKEAQRKLALAAETFGRERFSGESVAAMTKSHSRGMAAVVLSSGAGALGVDVEFADPGRPWGAILGRFVGGDPGPVEPLTGAAVWTFIEGWYKAFQDWPPAGLTGMALAAARDGGCGTVALRDAWWWTGLAAEGFPVSVVSTAPVDLERIDLPPISL
jgi:hypothetical protein